MGEAEDIVDEIGEKKKKKMREADIREKKAEKAEGKSGKTDLTSKLRENPWIVSTAVFALIAIILLVMSFSGGITGNVVSVDKASTTLVDYLNSLTGGGVSLVDSKDLGNIYEVKVNYQGKELPVYITKDGSYFVSSIQPITGNVVNQQQTQQTEVPKSDRPKVELFVMSYCPYGTQAEKGILPVVALLGDKIDFKLRTVHYVLHGDKEDLENKRELCIREEQGQTKLNKYLVCILDSDNPQAPADVSKCEKVAGVDSAKLKTCLADKADDYFAADSALSEGYGVQGSPTLIINGQIVESSRSPKAYLQGICNAFNNAPAECSESLSSSSSSTGFGYKEGTDTVAQC